MRVSYGSRLRESANPTKPYMPVWGAVISKTQVRWINCHGPNGLGGVPNPVSKDKAIPPLSGQGFRHDFPTDASIAAVIRSGSVIGRAPIVSMPHWGGIIPAEDVRALIAYLKTLK